MNVLSRDALLSALLNAAADDAIETGVMTSERLEKVLAGSGWRPITPTHTKFVNDAFDAFWAGLAANTSIGDLPVRTVWLSAWRASEQAQGIAQPAGDGPTSAAAEPSLAKLVLNKLSELGNRMDALEGQQRDLVRLTNLQARRIDALEKAQGIAEAETYADDPGGNEELLRHVSYLIGEMRRHVVAIEHWIASERGRRTTMINTLDNEDGLNFTTIHAALALYAGHPEGEEEEAEFPGEPLILSDAKGPPKSDPGLSTLSELAYAAADALKAAKGDRDALIEFLSEFAVRMPNAGEEPD